MRTRLKTVALLVANPALSSILATTLAGAPSLRVRPFETELALRTYLRLVPADLVVADFDSLPARADRLAERLGAEPGRRPPIVALASERTAGLDSAALQAGIAEIIMKPMSPRYLVERVLARLAGRPRRPTRPAVRDWSSYGDNVVPLFGRTDATLH